VPDSGVVEVRTAVATRHDADRLTRDAVAARLAACAHVSGPVTSHYHWKGTLESAEEWRCSFKTTRSRWPDLARYLHEHHPYELPEIIMLPLAGSDAYLAWVTDEVAG
jgi:periplasmic divalent cation tolerance protein